LKQRVIEAISAEVAQDFVLEKPKDFSFGHYATPLAFSLAKIEKKSPMIIADELCAKFDGCTIFESATAIKGFINFKLRDSFLDIVATDALKDEENFAKAHHDSSILLEYVSANPTGPLHIGHARGAVFGDSLYRIGKHLGYKIESEYYVNDAGNQIELLGLSLFLSGQEQFTEIKVEWPEEFYRGEYIVDLAKEAEAEFGKEIFTDSANIEKLSTWGKDKMLELIRQNLSDANITFDNYVSEKSLYSAWDATLQKLQKSGALYEKDGKQWLRSSEVGDEKDRVAVREDGRPTYLAGDIIYHDNKYERGYDHYINIWGADHHGYIARVKAAIHFLGHDENKLEVLLAQMVSLLKGGEPYKMSKRAGNFILMSEVVDEIGADALRFIFLSKKSDTHLEFDIDMFNQQDSSNPIFYVQYAHARINQIFEKAGKKPEDVFDVKLENLDEDSKNLLFTSLLLPEVLEDAFSSRALQKLPEYLKSLAALYHQFYNKHKIVGAENADVLLKVSAMAAVSLRTGLKLMGIEAKYKM
jgi:arginyl-tRNA synthetase